jgi:outer membrane protein assembly factor BamB
MSPRGWVPPARFKVRGLLLLSLAVLWLGTWVLVADAQEPGASWPMAGGDPAHRGVVSGPEPPYAELWRTPVDGGPLTAPVVSGDRVVVVGRERIAALTAESGRIVWDVVRSGGPAGPAAIVGDLAIHASGAGVNAGIVGRSMESGTPRWRAGVGSSVRGGVVADGGTAYAGTDEGFLVALRADTGEEVWRVELPGAVAAAPAVGGGLVVGVSLDRSTGATTVMAVDAETGEESWRFTTPPATPGATPAVVGDSAVFVGMGDARVHAFELETGAERWAARARAAALGTLVFFTPEQIPALAGDPLVGDLAHLALFDAGTGEEEWVFRFPGLLATSSPAVVGGSAVVGDGAGTLSAVDLEDGVVVWRRDLGPRPLSGVAADGLRVYVSTLGPGGDVVALEHDPEGSLVRIESGTTLFPLRAVLNFLIAGAAVGLVSVGLFRFVVKPRQPDGRPT